MLKSAPKHPFYSHIFIILHSILAYFGRQNAPLLSAKSIAPKNTAPPQSIAHPYCSLQKILPHGAIFFNLR